MQLSPALNTLPPGSGSTMRCYLDREAIQPSGDLRLVSEVLVRLGLMACVVEYLHVAVVVGATVDQCGGMVELEA